MLEGGDGSGKSTQARALADWLRGQGVTVLETFEPGAGAIGAVLRELLLHGPEPVAPVAEALLMAADRAQHVATEIEPALARGDWVVCDRYVPSSLVYQGVVRGLGVDVVEQLSAVATGGLAPDVVVLLDVSDEVAAAAHHESVPTSATGSSGGRARSTRRSAPRTETSRRARGWVVVDADGERRRRCRARPRRGRAVAGRMTGMVATEHWARIVGQDRAVAQLQRAASRPVHAYLLVGPRGSGIEEAARCFAAAVVAPDAHEQTSVPGTSCCAACTPTSSRSIRRRRRSASRTRRPSSTRCRAARSRASARS